MENIVGMKKRVRGVLLILSLQFAVGMFLNLFGVAPDEVTPTNPEPIYSSVAFFLHSITGILLFGGSIAILVFAFRSKKEEWKKNAWFGFGSIIVAFLGGILTVSLKDNASEAASLLMSLGFLTSFIFYGKFYMKLQK